MYRYWYFVTNKIDRFSPKKKAILIHALVKRRIVLTQIVDIDDNGQNNRIEYSGQKRTPINMMPADYRIALYQSIFRCRRRIHTF